MARSVLQVFSPPAVLAGRAGALRIKTKTKDLCLIAVYIPPAGTLSEKMNEACLQAITDWLSKNVDRLPRRTMPIAMGDLNMQFGLRRDVGGTFFRTSGGQHVGEWGEGL